MPDYVDVVRLNVRANRLPTVNSPALVTVYESQSVLFDIEINTGYPRATTLTDRVDAPSDAPLTDDIPYPTVTAVDSLSDVPGHSENGLLTYRVNAPALAGTMPQRPYIDWIVIFTITSSEGSDTSTTRIRVYHDLPATIDIAAHISAYETTYISPSFTYNIGSPTATEIRHSFHNSLADAISGSNPRTSGRPSVLVIPTATHLAGLAGGSVTDRTGQLSYQSNLPAVTSDTRWYGRVIIIQNGAVVDSAAYTLTILNAVVPSISIAGGYGIEGTRAVLPIAYESGAPYADRFSFGGWYNSQSDAQNSRNRLITSDGIPSNLQWDPTTPEHRTGQNSGFLRMTLPYVDADKRIWGKALIERDREGGGTDYWQTTFYIDILDRVPAQIDVQEIITMDEESTIMIMFTYTRGVPSATGYGVSIHENEADAENNRDAVMDSDDPRITLSAYDNTGSQTAQKEGTATIVAPDIGNSDRSWYPRFYMIQEIITPDP